jgi:predicted 3-demethylubiquinone-9 3-methyltransferase (glyoxalase superfamily)
MQKITTFLTFDGRADEAVQLYTSLFKNSKVSRIERWGAGGPVPEGSVLTAAFELNGQEFMAMDVPGGFPKGEGVSLFVECKDQAEVDHLWNNLSANGGEEQPCGWLKDKYGFSWQIIPKAFNDLMAKPDGPKKQAMVNAMLQMKKLIVKDLEDAYANG